MNALPDTPPDARPDRAGPVAHDPRPPSVACPTSSPFDLYGAPGHLIRRAQQIAVAIFMTRTGGRLTPIQFSALAALHASEALDQVTLARRIALDPSTSGQTLDRLEAKGWIERRRDPADRRRRLLTLTPLGRAEFDAARGAVDAAQDQILAPLTADERVAFVALLAKLVSLNNDHSRAPLERGPSGPG